MIKRSEMIPLLVQACPAFEAAWQEFRVEWANEPELPCYIAIGEFATHLSSVVANGNEEVLRHVFELIERLILEGDAYVREAAIVGVIEDLQNLNLHSGTKPEQYLPYLLPQTRRWWSKVEAFWSEGRLLTDD
jgi:hypothetical protein